MSKKPAVSNASPLIWLAKIGKLELLRVLFGKVVIPKRVYIEAVSEEKAPDAILIEDAVKGGWVEVSEEKLEDSTILAEAARIHLGEAEAILLARKLGADLIVDEKEASETAHIFGVTTMGTVAVLLLGLARDMLTFAEFKESLDGLISLGFWLSVDVYNRALEEAKSLSGG